MGGADSTVHHALSEDEVQDGLSDELAAAGNATFTVVEFAVGGATIFEISRDVHGTPTAIRWA